MYFLEEESYSGIGSINSTARLMKYDGVKIKKIKEFEALYSGDEKLDIDENNNVWFPILLSNAIEKYNGNNFKTFYPPGYDITGRVTLDKYGNLILSRGNIYPSDDHFAALFREGGVLLPEGAVPVTEKMEDNKSRASIFPNPFSQSSVISFQLPKPGNVLLNIYNSFGTKIKSLMNGFLPAGTQRQVFDGSALPAGV